MIYSFKGHKPVIHKTSFIHPLASVTGNVVIGKNVFIGSGAAIRGDIGKIIIEEGCNVQENCILHMFPGMTVRLKKGAHIGHGAIIHGATIGRNVLVGMHSVIMDHVVIGDNCIIGAMSLLTEGMRIPARKIVYGNPAKISKNVSKEMLKWKTEGTKIYMSLPAQYLGTMKVVSPNSVSGKVSRAAQLKNYKTWKRTKQ